MEVLIVAQETQTPETGNTNEPDTKDTERQVRAVKAKQFKAVCPINPKHSARVYDMVVKEVSLDAAVKGVGKKGDKVKVGVRKCVCDGCGTQWSEDADLPSETAASLPKYPDVRCKNSPNHSQVEAYMRLRGVLSIVCHQCNQDNTWTVADEISEARPTAQRNPVKKTPPHRRNGQPAEE